MTKKILRDNIFPTGEYKGLMVITEDDLNIKNCKAVKDSEIPTKLVPVYKTVVLTGQNCQNTMTGDIEKCQNLPFCGLCQDSYRAKTSTNFEKFVRPEERLNMVAYISSLPIKERKALGTIRN